MAGKRALVVDDEKLIVKGIRFSLEQDDMEVDCAYDGEEALEYAKNNKYDIILLDPPTMEVRYIDGGVPKPLFSGYSVGNITYYEAKDFIKFLKRI